MPLRAYTAHATSDHSRDPYRPARIYTSETPFQPRTWEPRDQETLSNCSSDLPYEAGRISSSSDDSPPPTRPPRGTATHPPLPTPSRQAQGMMMLRHQPLSPPVYTTYLSTRDARANRAYMGYYYPGMVHPWQAASVQAFGGYRADGMCVVGAYVSGYGRRDQGVHVGNGGDSMTYDDWYQWQNNMGQRQERRRRGIRQSGVRRQFDRPCDDATCSYSQRYHRRGN